MVKCTRENRYVAKQWQKDKYIELKEIGYLFFFHTFILAEAINDSDFILERTKCLETKTPVMLHTIHHLLY